MDTPQISRSGRVLKKSAKVKEMEDFDINDLDMQGKPRKKGRMSDEYDEFDDKRVAPIKIPKISLNIPQAAKRPQQMITKMSPAQLAKAKMEKKFMMRDSSPDGSKESDSSSMSSETTSSSDSSSSDSEGEMPPMRPVKTQMMHTTPQEKVIVESYRQFESPVTFGEQSSAADNSDDDENSDSALVIAEESGDSFGGARAKTGAVAVAKKRQAIRKDPTYPPRKPGPPKKRAPAARPPAAKKDKPPGKTKALSAYMLWCNENRKKVAAGSVGFGNIGKKLGEAWQALPDKEKMAWRRKAKKLAQINDSRQLLSASTPTDIGAGAPSSCADEGARGAAGELAARALGTSAIDSAAYLKLLGDSLSVIGQRLTEHEGQLAVSGIFSVLLDTILCVVGPLLCLASESPVLDALPRETSRRTLDSIAYFMPGL